jgi:hypothetical protein
MYGAGTPLSLHDPLVVWSLLAPPRGGIAPPAAPADVRVEAAGQWTRGMCVVDGRGLASDDRPPPPGDDAAAAVAPLEVAPGADDVAGEPGAASSEAGWLDGEGNRVFVVGGPTGWEETFGEEMLRRIYGR